MPAKTHGTPKPLTRILRTPSTPDGTDEELEQQIDQLTKDGRLRLALLQDKEGNIAVHLIGDPDPVLYHALVETADTIQSMAKDQLIEAVLSGEKSIEAALAEVEPEYRAAALAVFTLAKAKRNIEAHKAAQRN